MRGERRRCGSCGQGDLCDDTRTLSVALPRCGVVASVAAPARRCPGCGELHVDVDVRARAYLSVGCELADRGIHGGDVLRHLRKALGLRAADLARLLGITPETISHWETGKAPAARAAFVALAAMAEEALDGRTTTRDRLELLCQDRRFPRAVTVRLRSPARR